MCVVCDGGRLMSVMSVVIIESMEYSFSPQARKPTGTWGCTSFGVDMQGRDKLDTQAYTHSPSFISGFGPGLSCPTTTTAPC